MVLTSVGVPFSPIRIPRGETGVPAGSCLTLHCFTLCAVLGTASFGAVSLFFDCQILGFGECVWVCWNGLLFLVYGVQFPVWP